MTKFTSPLNNLKVASPCEESWDAMLGNERKRYCGRCKLNVYNLSGMAKAEAENLLNNADGRVCVRFYQRTDGSVITQDCPVGWAKVKTRAKMMATAAFSLVLSLFSGLMFASFGKNHTFTGKLAIPFITPTPEVEMGEIAIPQPTPKAKPKETPIQLMGAIAAPTPKATPKNTPEPTMGKIKIQPKETPKTESTDSDSDIDFN